MNYELHYDENLPPLSGCLSITGYAKALTHVCFRTFEIKVRKPYRILDPTNKLIYI